MSFKSSITGYKQVVQNNPLRLKITSEELARIKRDYNPSNAVWRKFLSDVRTILQEETQRRFDTETDPNGVPWTKLRRPRPGKGILDKTSHMRNSFTYPIRTDPSAFKRWVELQVRIDVPYSRFHQEGTVKMVARPFLGFTGRMWLRIERLIRDFERQQRIR